MIPNPDIWGAPSTWEAGSGIRDWGKTNAIIGGKYPVFDTTQNSDNIARYSIASGVAANKLIKGEAFDTSCCPWRIKGDSYWISGRKKLFLPLHGSDTALQLYTDDVAARGCPVMLTTYPSTAYNAYPKLTNINKIWTPTPEGAGITTDIETTPLLKFDYSKIILRCRVAACRYNDDTTSSIYDVDDYYENRASTYTYIRSLIFDVYVNNGGTWEKVDYHDFNIIPINATIAGFEAESITAFNEDFSVISDGFNGNTVGGIDQTGIIRYYSNERGDTESECFYNSYSRNSSIRYAAVPDDWTVYTRVSSGNFYLSAYAQNMPKEWVMQQFAALGLWFYTGGVPAVDLSAPDEHTHVPLFDEYGTTTGDYLSGTSALTAPAAAWTDDVFERDIYHGEPPFDPTEYDDNTTELPDLSTSYIPTTAKLYPLQAGTVQTLIAYLNNVSANLTSDYDSATKFLTNNPIDVICGLMYYPFDIVDNYAGELSAASNIILGNVETDISALHLNKAIVEYDAGSVIYYPPDGLDDFRSYKPYSSAELYIPYCGSVDIDPTDYIGHNIGVKYLIDLQSGSCLALVYRDAMVLTSITGQIGVSVPLTGIQTATLQAAQQRADSTQKAAKMQAAGAAVSAVATAGALIAAVPTGGTSIAALAAIGTAGGLITGGMQGLDRHNDLQYQLEHQQTPYKTAGTASAVTSMANEQRCRLIIKRPVMLDNYQPDIYAHDTGYACCITAPLSSFSGYTKISNADLSGISCTSAERAALIAALQAGVYL